MIRRVAPVAAVSSTLPPIRLIPPPIPTTNITLVPTAPASQQPLPLPSYSTAPLASAAGFQRPGYQHVRLQLEPSATAPKRVLADPADAGQPPVKIIIRPQTAERREIVVVPRSNDPGLPVIQSVRGNVSSAKPNPAIQILSREIAQTTSVSSLLANPNITLTPRDRSKDNTAADSAPVTENMTCRPARPETVDLTLEPHAAAAQALPSKNLTCQVCDKIFSSASVLKTHLQLHLKRSITGYSRVSPPVAATASNSHTPEVLVSSTNEINRTVSTDPSSAQLSASAIPNSRLLDPLASTRSSPISISFKPPPPPPPPPASASASASTSTSASASSQKNGTSKELFIPIVDVSRAGVLSQLEAIGIESFIPISNLTAGADKSFMIPLVSVGTIRKSGNVFSQPMLSGLLNLGSQQQFHS